MAISVRKPDGEIETDVQNVEAKGKWYRKAPIIRGCVGFFDSIITSMKALMFSAEFFDIEEDGEDVKPSKFEAWLEKTFGEKLKTYLIYFSVAVSLILGIGVFFVLPTVVVNFAQNWYGNNSVIRSLLEGLVRIIIFLGYIYLVSKQSDIKRVFQYHGAEHKTIFCYEAGLPLNVENCKNQPRLHPRCGTSFLLFVMVISIILFSFIPPMNYWLRIVVRLLLLPVVAGLSYEVIKWAGRSDSKIVAVISKPGLWLQRITTNEPDESQLEVAISSMLAVIPENQDEDKW